MAVDDIGLRLAVNIFHVFMIVCACVRVRACVCDVELRVCSFFHLLQSRHLLFSSNLQINPHNTPTILKS